MKHKFKNGDRVKLKNGGAIMTVTGNASSHTALGVTPIKDKYECLWNDGKKNQKAVFHEDAIVLVA